MAENAEGSVVLANTKNLGDAPAMAMATLYQGMAADMIRANQNATANQQQMNIIAQAGVTMAVNKLINMDPTEAISVLKGISGNDLAQQLVGLMSALGAGQVSAKEAQTTPPETGTGG